MNYTRITPDSSNIHNAAMSADGNVVAYLREPAVMDMETPDTSELHLFDRRTGQSIQITSSEDDPVSWTDGTIGDIALTADGSKVLFISRVSTLTDDDNDTGSDPIDQDLYIYDVASATTRRFKLMDREDPNDWNALDHISEVTASADGSKIAFVATDGGWGEAAVYLCDMATQAVTRISIDELNEEGDPSPSHYHEVQISADGKEVFYRHVGDSPLIVYSVETKERTVLTGDIASTGGENESLNGSSYDVSGDGRFVAYQATNDEYKTWIEVLDRQTGEKETVSVSSTGVEANENAVTPSISDDGRFVLFSSKASNLAPGDALKRADVFIHDRQTGETKLLTHEPDGVPSSPGSYAPEISADGKTIIMRTTVEWDPMDANEQVDVYMTGNPFFEAEVPNEAPVAVNDTATATEDTPVVIDLLANDSDPEGQALRVLSVDGTGPHAGTATVNSDGTVTYRAADSLKAGETVQDVLTYTVADAGGKTASATLTVTATGVNDAPVTLDNTFIVDQGTVSGNLVAELLANDHDPEGDKLEIVAVEGPFFGAFTFDRANQTLTFDASAENLGDVFPEDYLFSQTFRYTVRDSSGAETTQEASISIRCVNDAPETGADAVTIAEDATTENLWDLLQANDVDPDADASVTIASVDTTATKGQVRFDPGARTLFYDATGFDALRPGETAEDTFTYTLRDEYGAETQATVTVTVTGENDAPNGTPNNISVQEGETSANIAPDLLANDFDSDALPGELKIVAVSGTTQGVLSLDEAAQTVTFSAEGEAFDKLGAGQSVTENLGYTVEDGFGGQYTAALLVHVTGVNDAPVAVSEGLSADETMQADITDVLLSNDTDVDAGDTRSIVAVDLSQAPGIRFDAATGRVHYDGSVHNSLRAGEHVVGTFTYTLRDSGGLESTATVMVRTDGVNDAPTAQADALSVAEDAVTANLWTQLLANDQDVDAGDTRTIVSVDTTGTKGVVVFDPNTQTLRYVASGHGELEAGQTGTDTFTYTVRDAAGALSTATVTLSVAGAREDDGWIYGTASDDLMEGTDAAEKFRALEDDDQVSGRGGDDVIEGGAGNDLLDGEAGRDSVFGDAGADVILGGRGDAQLDGGADKDLGQLDFSGSTQQLQFTVAENLSGTEMLDGVQIRGFESVELVAGSGNDYLIGGADIDVFRGGEGGDTIEGGFGAADAVFGEGGDDYLVVQSGIGVISGGEGVDHGTFFLDGRRDGVEFSVADNLIGTVKLGPLDVSGLEQVSIVGTRTHDRFTGGALGDHFNGLEGADTLIGLAGDDTLDGTSGDDVLIGGEGRDRLLGGSHRDTVTGGFGDQEVDGGFDQDHGILDFAASTAALEFVTAANLAGKVTVDGVLVGGFEQLSFTAGSAADKITGGALADRLTGGAGDDQLRGEGSDDTLIGGAGSDTLIGGDGEDELWGDTPDAGLAGRSLAGAVSSPDVLDGGAGADTFHAGAGSTLTGGEGADVFILDGSDAGVVITDLQTGPSGDTIDVSALLDGSTDPFSTGRLKLEAREGGSVLLFDADGSGSGAAVEIATVQGVAPTQLGAANFTATGPNGDPVVVDPTPAPAPVNVIRGTNKSEALNGTGGRDDISGLQGQDLIRGGGGDDKIDGGEGLDALFGDGGDDFLFGGNSADGLHGGDGADVLNGGAGVDLLYGGDGTDVLIGGAGSDLMWGGAGQDRFVMERGGSDVIWDFQAGSGAGDVLDLRAFTGVDSMSDLKFRSVFGSVVVDFGGGSVTLAGVSRGQLAADDFLFAGQDVMPVSADPFVM